MSKSLLKILILLLIPITSYGKVTAPYGRWNSPFTEEMLSRASSGFESIKVDSAHPENVYFAVALPAENRSTIYKIVGNSLQECLPKGYNVASSVHYYGGGEFNVYDNIIYFSNPNDNRIYKLNGCNITPIPITPVGDFKYAEFTIDPVHKVLYAIREEFKKGQRPEDSIIRLNLASQQMIVFDKGHDFYSSLALSPDATKLAWITWDFPNMPWDTTTLWQGTITIQGRLADVKPILNKAETAVFQPQWSPDGILYFVADIGGWSNIYRFQNNAIENVYPSNAEFGLSTESLGTSTYSFIDNKHIAASYMKDGKGYLGILNTASHKFESLILRYTEFASIRSNNNALYFFATGPLISTELVKLDLASRKTTPLYVSQKIDVDPGFISIPQHMRYQTKNGHMVHANYYPPTNKNYKAPAKEKPPLIILIHGGPTGRAYTFLDTAKQYWTSRGYAIFDVDFEGSTGYGRAYRQYLKGHWGIVDRDAAIEGARYMIDRELADPHRLILKGYSAGGYTVLRTLTSSSLFQVGTSYYGWSPNFETALKRGPKIESNYLTGLIAPYPSEIKTWKERSPINYAQNISGALLMIQGNKDQVALAADAEEMFQKVKEHGNPVAILLLPEEGHGFQNPAALIKSLLTEKYFYEKILGIKPIPEEPPFSEPLLRTANLPSSKR